MEIEHINWILLSQIVIIYFMGMLALFFYYRLRFVDKKNLDPIKVFKPRSADEEEIKRANNARKARG